MHFRVRDLFRVVMIECQDDTVRLVPFAEPINMSRANIGIGDYSLGSRFNVLDNFRVELVEADQACLETEPL